jgi:hypothetical protein
VCLEGMWCHNKDERVLEQCVGILTEWRTVICQAAVAGATMTGRLPPGPRGPPTDRGPGGGALGAP